MVQDLKIGRASSGAWGMPEAQFKQLADRPARLHHSAGLQKGFDDLGFNCYTGPSLRQPGAAGLAVPPGAATGRSTSSKLVEHRLRRPAPRRRPRSSDPDYYDPTPTGTGRRRPARPTRFDLAKASQMLTAAGYPLKNGVRLNKQGKPIVLRLCARSEPPAEPAAGKLIAGWFAQLGLKIKLSVHRRRRAHDRHLQLRASTFKPDYDMFLWDWGGGPDPNFILSVFTTAQINNWSDCAWSEPAYDRLFLEQQTTIDPTKRAGHRPPDGADHLPAVALHHLRLPQVGRGLQLQGLGGVVDHTRTGGGVFFTSPVMASYLSVHPAPAAATAAAQSTPRTADRRGRGDRPDDRRRRPGRDAARPRRQVEEMQ